MISVTKLHACPQRGEDIHSKQAGLSQTGGFVTGRNNSVERNSSKLKRGTNAVVCFESLRSSDNLMLLVIEYPIPSNGASPTDPDLRFTLKGTLLVNW